MNSTNPPNRAGMEARAERRELLFNRTKAITLSAIACGCLCCVGITSALSGAVCAFLCILHIAVSWAIAATFLIVFSIFVTLVVLGFKWVVASEKSVASILSVPPVREQSGAVGAGSLLVRSLNNSLKERGKRRRKYLRRKAALAAVAGIAAVITVLCGLCAVTSLDGNDMPRTIPGTFVFGVLFSLFRRAYLFSIVGFDVLPRVPPVGEQIAGLSADEVLLRGSAEPHAKPEDLLRAAHYTPFDPAEELVPGELLRAVRSGTISPSGELVRVDMRTDEWIRRTL